MPTHQKSLSEALGKEIRKLFIWLPFLSVDTCMCYSKLEKEMAISEVRKFNPCHAE